MIGFVFISCEALAAVQRCLSLFLRPGSKCVQDEGGSIGRFDGGAVVVAGFGGDHFAGLIQHYQHGVAIIPGVVVGSQHIGILVTGAEVDTQENIMLAQVGLYGLRSEGGIKDDAGVAPVAAHQHKDVLMLLAGSGYSAAQVLRCIGRRVENIFQRRLSMFLRKTYI